MGNPRPKSPLYSSIHRGRIPLILLGFCCVALAVPVLMRVYQGSFMRLNGDDYCYAATETQHGFWGSQWYAYQHIGKIYNGNRYSLNLALAVSSFLGPKYYGLLLGAGIFFFLGTIFFSLYQYKNLMHRQASILEILFIGLVLISFVIYVIPDVTQILFWFTGMSTYLMPLCFNLLLLGIILATNNFKLLFQLPIIFILSIIAGGFSETTAVIQLVWITFMIVGVYFLDRTKKLHRLLLPALVGLIATLLSILLLAFSPATSIRLGAHNDHPALIELVLLTVKYTIAFFYTNIKSALLPYSIVLSLGLFYSYIRKMIYGLTDGDTHALTKIGVVGLSCLLIVAASISPSVYAQYAYPGERALFPARFITILSLFMIGYYIGVRLLDLKFVQKNEFRVLAYGFSFLFTLALGFYMFRATGPMINQIPFYQKWAYFWDLRDSQIREDRQAGILDIQVTFIDHVIKDVVELTSNPEAGYNRCAATYYGVHTITADLPGWDQ